MSNVEHLVIIIKSNLMDRGISSYMLEEFIRNKIVELRFTYRDNSEFVQQVAKLNLLKQEDINKYYHW